MPTHAVSSTKSGVGVSFVRREVPLCRSQAPDDSRLVRSTVEEGTGECLALNFIAVIVLH